MARCLQDDCEAERVNSKRVACVDGKYSGSRAVGRYAIVCADGCISVVDELEG